MKQKFETDLEQEHRKRSIADGWLVVKIVRAIPNGFPDRFYARNGRIVLIEFKRPGSGRVSPQQVKRHAELRAAGVEIHVVDSLSKAERVLCLENSQRRNEDTSTDEL